VKRRPPTDSSLSPAAVPSLRAAARVWLKIGLLGFGGPAGQIALLQRELVERRRWLDERRFLHALNYCMLLPGPEAQQLATYVGWLLHGIPGGVVAGTLFVLPGFVAILGLSALYASFGHLAGVAAVFFGLKAAVLAIVVEAVVRVGKRAVRGWRMLLIAAGAFAAITFVDVPFPLVVLVAGGLGFLDGHLRPEAFPEPDAGEVARSRETLVDRLEAAGALPHARPSGRRAVRVLVTCLVLWAAPVVALGARYGRASVFVAQGIFFSKAAVVSVGGGYAVLSYVARRAVDTYGWLRAGEMLDGLGLAETTPGPLIMVVQFVGYLGAYRAPGALPREVAGLLGSLVTVWVTFLPSFLWIFLGAPYVEALRRHRPLRGALAAITASVVGVILNLSLWFALHVLFGRVSSRTFGPLHVLVPQLASVDPAAAILAALALVAMLRFKVGLPQTLLGCASLGVVWWLLH
jgi:chromate transporter